jgi:general secretion pathway protein A
MYLEFFGFSALPFELTPDPRFLYLTPGHQEALSTLQYGVMSGKGLTVLTGEAGLGKTTLLRTTLEQMHGVATRLIVVSNPALTRQEFIEVIARSLDLTETIGTSKPAVLSALESALTRDHANGTRAVLVADEAHVMPDQLLEEIRLLGNFETATTKLLSIVLVGQPELAERLNQPSLRQLKQRVALRCGLLPFTRVETNNYIETRLHVVGRTATDIFTAEALGMIHLVSRGIPRVINVVCDNALLTAFAADQRVVTDSVIEQVRQDFDLAFDTAPPPVVITSEANRRPAMTQPPAEIAPTASAPVAPLVPELVVPVKAAPPRRPKPPNAPSPAPPKAGRDGELFTVYTRRKGFFSRVFS